MAEQIDNIDNMEPAKSTKPAKPVKSTDPTGSPVTTPITSKTPHALREEKILAYWKEKGIFEKTLERKSPKGEYIFYDGPPFANGLPHYGHILAGVIKDVVPRFKTMQGYHVPRKWGWDCHGLPVENLIEKELQLKSKKDIVTYGIDRFNAAAKESVMRYADEWRAIVPRLGRWVDMEDDYRTMDATYTESVWWIFKQLHDKGLIYEGFKSMNLCPRCETTLSNFEVAQGYKDITDISVTVKFRVLDVADTYLLAWTTTPWTLPGNVALAVGKDIEYTKVKIANEYFILAKSRLSVLKDTQYESVEEFKGADLVGKRYQPLFDHYSKNQKLKNHENGWQVYAAGFVTTEDGTGIVHIAPAFGADDYDLMKVNSLPFVQHVTMDGVFKSEVTDFAGLHVKPKDTDAEKDAHQKTDIEIIKWLAHGGKLFSKEKLVHSYPHCWRCDTPLLNYATSSWFVKVTDIKDKLVSENKKVTWVPPEVGEGRFGNWLEGARDWAISRSRFWGAPIPVWREEKIQDPGVGSELVNESGVHCIGSVEDLRKYSHAKNNYHVMRHGEAENNTLNVLDSSVTTTHHLTEKGREQVAGAVKELRSLKIDLIFVSPILRTKETAEMVKIALGLGDDKLIVDNRIAEYNPGVFQGKSVAELGRAHTASDRWLWRPEGGEDYMDIKKRTGEFLYDIEGKYEGKNILVVTHETPAMLLCAAAMGMDIESAKSLRLVGDFMKNAEVRKLDFVPLPHNTDYELDLHRPFIDEVQLMTKEGNKLVRVPDVFDCWFESGSMPYASEHHPFENRDKFEPHPGLLKKSIGFPADFIAEGLDQTRGWFYSMMVLGVALFGKTPYKKVVVNGLVLAEDGEKMSKRKQNYPDPMGIVEKYGADSLRYYLLSSPVVHGQDLCFSERGVDEVTKKLLNRLLNVVSFYEMYSENSVASDSVGNATSTNVLDRWIVSRLNETISLVTKALEAGELDRATRPFMDLTDDLSTWYLRRSRDRFKSGDMVDKKFALETTMFVLLEIAKLIAPFMPFLAEDIYSRMSGELESVHLEMWPTAGKVEGELLVNMRVVREVSSRGLEARMKAKINVRQPLQKLKVGKVGIGTIHGDAEFVHLVRDEVNVKEVDFNATLSTEVELDTTISPELREEGVVRELIRAVQDMRKDRGFTVNDKVSLKIETNDEGRAFVEKYRSEISAATSLRGIEFATVEGEFQNIGGLQIKLGV